MKTVVLLAITIMLAACPVFAQGQSVGISWTDQYRWHGFGVFDNDYVHPGVTAQMQGIDVSAISHIGNNEQDVKYWDAILGYTIPMGAFNVRAGYSYLIFPGQDIQEVLATVSLPGDISPRYTFAQVMPDNSDEGQLHIFGVDTTVGCVNLMAEITYNDGVNPFGPAVSDWSHATTGLSVDIPIGKMTLIPAVYYQHTMEPLVNDTIDEVFFAANLIYKF